MKTWWTLRVQAWRWCRRATPRSVHRADRLSAARALPDPLGVHGRAAEPRTHWTIGRRPWKDLGAPTRSVSRAPWVGACETLRLREPGICTAAEQRALVTERRAAW